MKRVSHWKNEDGAVSFMTVIFFILFLAVIAVSFVAMITSERQRALQNELSELALAAAESGIEDGKRIIVYCMNNQDADTQAICAGVENQNDCDSLINAFNGSGTNPAIITTSGTGEVRIGGDDYNQEYTCLKIDRYTKDVEYKLSSVDTKNPDVTASVIIPLDIKDNASVSNFVLQWHLLDKIPNGDGESVTLRTNHDNTDKTNWGTAPAMLRVEIVKVPKSGNYSIQGLIGNTSAVYLRPMTNSAGEKTASDIIQIMDYQPKSSANESANPPVVGVKCVGTTEYKCAATLTYDSNKNMNTATDDYFIKLTSLYRDTHIRLLLPGDLQFNNLQPLIDVTGKVGDTLRRVLTRVATNDAVAGEVFFPEYALETAAPVCKKMAIKKDTGADQCTY